jgi:hypothetical protein
MRVPVSFAGFFGAVVGKKVFVIGSKWEGNSESGWSFAKNLHRLGDIDGEMHQNRCFLTDPARVPGL